MPRSIILCLWFLVCTALCGCGSSDDVSRPRTEGDKDFTVAKGDVNLIRNGYVSDTYTVSLYSAENEYLQFDLTSHSLTPPSGLFVTEQEAERAHGTISNIRYSRGSTLRDPAKDLTLRLTPSSDGYSFSGTLTTAAGTKINVSGQATISFERAKRVLVFPTLTEFTQSGTGIDLLFDISESDAPGSESYRLSVPFVGVTDISDIESGEYALAKNPATLSARHLCAGGVLNQTSAVIDTGVLAVSIIGNVLVGKISWENFDISFTHTLPQGTPDVKEYEELTRLLSVKKTDQNFITVKMSTEGVSMEYNPATWQTRYVGTGKLIDLEIFAPEGTLQPGTYTVSDKAAPGTFRAGWNPGDIYGIGVNFENWGTCLYRLEDNNMTISHITDGLVVVEREGDTYTIKITNSLIAARYTGPVTPATD